jgi:hypothetical protein
MRLTLEHPYPCKAEGDNMLNRIAIGDETSISSKYAQPCNESTCNQKVKMLPSADKVKLSAFGILKVYCLPLLKAG